MDFSKTENIIFVSVVGAAILFFLAVTIAVIAKGKRVRKAGDVLLLIFGSLVFICSTVLLVCAVFSMLGGNYRIDVTDVPTLVFGANSIVLPVPELFNALATTIGSDLVTGIFVVSLVAIVSDGLLTRRKKKEKKAESAQETPAKPEMSELGGAYNTAVSDTAATGEPPEDENVAEDEAVDNDEKIEGSEQYEAASAFDEQSDELEQTAAETADENYADSEPTAAFDDGQEDKPWYNEDGEFDLDGEPQEAEAPSDELEYSDEQENTEPSAELEPEQTDEIKQDEKYTEQADDEADLSQTYDGDTENYSDEYAESEPDENHTERDEPQEYSDEALVEPDRDIYIPEIRTVKRDENKTAKPETKKATSRPAQKPAAGKKSGAKTKQANKERSSADNKSLPVGRRYVILDRRSAVNIFSDYLKDRDKQNKEKLESSINKIILK